MTDPSRAAAAAPAERLAESLEIEPVSTYSELSEGAQATEYALSLTLVSKRFGYAVAIDSLSLDVPAGELLALVGPSGCGKTTLLRLIAGLEVPDRGLIQLWGRTATGKSTFLPPEARRVSLVFQDYALFPHITVADNVSFGLRGWDRKARAARVDEMLHLVRLPPMAGRYPHELSGGEQQRVALARALAPRPAVLLLDEPFSNLDAAQRVQVREEVREILKASGATAIFVTHDQEEALFMGDRVAVLNAGRLEQVGAPDEIFGAPATRFVAEFMGPTDFIPGKTTLEGVRTEIGTLTQQVDLPVGAHVEVAVRADDVDLAPDPASSARVMACNFKGTANVYRVRLPSGSIVHSLQPHTMVLKPGTPVRVWADPGHPLVCFPRNNATEMAAGP